MIETSFRDAPRMLACPRCGSTLSRMTAGVEMCVRCEGIWLAAPTLESTFGTKYWPQGPSAWWRRSLECPSCAVERGQATEMTPVLAADVIVDRCPDHGVWLDAGELGRLLDAPRSIEIEAFYQRIPSTTELPAALVEFRKQRDDERERRARELDAFRAREELDQARIRAEREAARAAEEKRIAALAAAERRVALLELQATLQGRFVEAERESETRERTVNDQRAAVLKTERLLDEQRERLRALEHALVDARARVLELSQRMAGVNKELRS